MTFAQHALDRASLAGDLRVRTTEVRLSSSGYCADVCSRLLRLKRSGEPAIAIVANSACIPIVAAVSGWLGVAVTELIMRRFDPSRKTKNEAGRQNCRHIQRISRQKPQVFQFIYPNEGALWLSAAGETGKIPAMNPKLLAFLLGFSAGKKKPHAHLSNDTHPAQRKQ